MNVAFRVDASVEIGTGHVMRCLTLAQALTERGHNVAFICRNHQGNLGGYIRELGYVVYMLPYHSTEIDSALHGKYVRWLGVDWRVDAIETCGCLKRMGRVDWLVADHYALDSQWEQIVRSSVIRVMVIDDLANRTHVCDLLLDQGLFEDSDVRYRQLVPEQCTQLLGPKYALLRNEFSRFAGVRRRDGTVRKILVFYGGVDATDETSKVVEAIQGMGLCDVRVDVIVGSTNQRVEQIRSLCEFDRTLAVHFNVSNMAEMMDSADLAFGAGGTTAWERCFLGLPTAVTVVANNQIGVAENLARMGAAWNLGWYKDVSVETIRERITYCLHNAGELQAMSHSAKAIMGQQIGTVDVIDCMVEEM